MIRYTTGNILLANAEALVNTVNCVGIMGRGIALQFKRAFPQNFKEYAVACKRGEVLPGRMLVHDTGQLMSPRYIINFPTKRHWQGKSRIEDIEAGLEALVAVVRELGIRSIALPPLGSGLGGLHWSDVRPRIEQALQAVPEVDVLVYEPGEVPTDAKPNRSTPVPRMTAGRAALVGLMSRYLGGLMDPSISLLEIHKLMYFLQVSGEPLRLTYVKALHGPYAENLRHVLSSIEGHLISGYQEDGDTPHKQLALVPGVTDEADAYLAAHDVTQQRFERVARLVEGFETPFGLELLATVHWIMTAEHALDREGIVNKTYAWGSNKRQFTSDQLALAADRLRDQGWAPSAAALV